MASIALSGMARNVRDATPVDTDRRESAPGTQLASKSLVACPVLCHCAWLHDITDSLFSGRRAPERAGADAITREAYSHEVISCGFWPGNATFPHEAFYSYTYPTPVGLERATIRPEAAYYSPQMGEFLLRYEDMRYASAPEQALLEFFYRTYEAEATLAGWDRQALERHPAAEKGERA